MLPARIGTRISYYRNARGLRVVDLSRLAGLTPGYLSLIENGKANITLATLAALAQALGVSQQELLPSEDSRERDELRRDINSSLEALPMSALRALAGLLASTHSKTPDDPSDDPSDRQPGE